MFYDREKAVEYAHNWAFSRNPNYFSFTGIGGDCTNFISQCIHAGGAPMNYAPTYGWYYISPTNRAPAWTGVQFLYNFLTRTSGRGPFGKGVPIDKIEIGDIIQLSFDGVTYEHSLLVVERGIVPSPDNILIATHTDDSDYRPLSTYSVKQRRYIHIEGTRFS
ncbi:MAG: amidase domain-containing protein [Bacillota bacterium]|nr:amidase domain-containing protein [Bacillota bacterium]